MSEMYRKRGSVVRYEHGCVVRVFESGEAVEDGLLFRSFPIDSRSPLATLPAPRGEGTDVHEPLEIERMILTEGFAQHAFGDVRWEETTRRMHIAIAHRARALRVLIDLGDFELDDVRIAADALARAGSERDAPARVILAPNVSAALLPSLVGTNVVELWQSAAPHDGKGQPILAQRITKGPGPNWYRPSYRTRPIRMPFHLRAKKHGDFDDDLPRAVALLAPVAGNVLHVLCVDRGDVFPTTITVERVLAVKDEVRWYPYSAGVYGAEMLV